MAATLDRAKASIPHILPGTQKLMFFDIDGTLLPFQSQVPESARQALRQARAMGHKLFLCSGRSECLIARDLLELGFDGIISAAGATIRYRDQRVRMVSAGDKIHKLIRILEDCQAIYTLQTPDASFSPMNTLQWEKAYNLEQFHIVHAPIACDPSQYRHTEKAVVFTCSLSHEQLAQQLAPEFELTASCFDPNDRSGCEITLTGVNKSSAMQWLGEYLGVGREDMIAFGDGANDLDMLRYAGTGIAMGNAVPEAKAAADCITKPVTEDGIHYAMQRLLYGNDPERSLL